MTLHNEILYWQPLATIKIQSYFPCHFQTGHRHKMSHILALPLELQFIILNNCTLKGLHGLLAQVCTKWNKMLHGTKTLHLGSIIHSEHLLMLYKDGIMDHVRYRPNSFFENVCFHGHLHCLKETLTIEYDINMYYVQSASRGGHLHILKWFSSFGIYPNHLTALAAVRHGHRHILKWISEEHECSPSPLICSEAVKTGGLSLLKYVISLGFVYDDEICNEAARKGDFECLRWAIERHCPISAKLYHYACVGGNLNCLLYLSRLSLPFDITIKCYSNAAHFGHLDVLQWLITNHGKPLCESVCAAAANRGSFECLKYMHEINLPWDERVCINAAYNNHIECLKYAHDNGCPWDEWVCTSAAMCGNIDCLKYARNNGCPWDKLTCVRAAESGHLDCLIWARTNGCFWDESICVGAAKNGHLHCLKWARNNGCPCGVETFKTAYKHKHTHVLKWMKESGFQCHR